MNGRRNERREGKRELEEWIANRRMRRERNRDEWKWEMGRGGVDSE
jgi:hypothetical protein